MWRLVATTCLVSHCNALHVEFMTTSNLKLITLQDFGTAGGSVNVSISVAPVACLELPPSFNSTQCWDALDQTYLVILSYEQWRNLSHWLAENDDGMHSVLGGSSLCLQPAVGWSPLSLLAWLEAVPDGNGVANFTVSGRDFLFASVAHEQGRLPPVPPATIRFAIDFTLPQRQDLYTLGLYNCFGSELRISGEARFVGGNGATLSTRQIDVLAVRLGLVATTLACALLLGFLCWFFRATVVPLHALLIVVLLLRCMQQIFLVLPLIAASRDVLSPAGGIITASTLDSYNSADSQRDDQRSSQSAASSVAATPGGDGTLAPPPPSPYSTSGHLYATPSQSINASEWGLQTSTLLGAAASEQMASLCFITALLAISAGRHFLFPATPSREREALTAAYVLYFGFGMLQEACTGEVLCGVFVLSYQVVRILLVFAVLLFLNSTADYLRRASGHHWPSIRVDVLRLLTFRQIRLRLLLVYLILPIIFLFLEVVLEWQATWWRLVWREALELYIVLAVIWRLPPTPAIYSVHFAGLRPSPNAELAPGIYPRFFRWLLGSDVNTARADAAIASHVASAQRRQQFLRQGRRNRTDHTA